jgi:MFS family permease
VSDRGESDAGPPPESWSGARARVVHPAAFERPRPAASEGFRAALAPLLPLFALDVLTAFTVGMIPPLLPLVAGDFALSAAEAGLVHTVYALGRLAAAYPASRLRAWRGSRVTIFVGIGGLAAGSLGCALAPDFGVFLVARLVMGLGASAAFLAVFAELLETSPPAWRGRLNNLFEGMAISSVAVGGVLASAFAQGAGWRVVFGAAAALVLLTYWSIRSLGAHAGRRQPGETGQARAISTAEVTAVAPIWIAAGLMAATWSGLFATLAPLLGHDHYGMGARAIGLALGAGYVTELAGLAGVGLLVDRVRREPLFLGGALSVLAGGLVLAVGTHPAAFVGGLALVGGGFAVWMIPATVLADRVGAALPPFHLAAYRIAADAGMIVGPLGLGLLATATGDRPAVAVAGLAMVAGALVLARRPRRAGAIIRRR